MDLMDEQLAEMTLEDKQNSCKRPFRLKSMTKDMIDTVFHKSIHQSKKEEHVLEPGPATLLMRLALFCGSTFVFHFPLVVNFPPYRNILSKTILIH
jgi:hypothetical protein